MPAQSLLAKAGLRFATLGSSASLAVAAPLVEGSYDTAAHTGAARSGFYFDQTPGAELMGVVAGGDVIATWGKTGIAINKSTTVTATADAQEALVVKGFSPTQSANIQEWQNSAGGVLAFISPAGVFGTNGAQTVKVRSVPSAGATTVLGAADYFICVTGALTQTLTLPAATDGRVLVIKNRSTGLVTVNRAGADTIDGGTTIAVASGASITLIANATDWTLN
jgi:hypothetical protein